MKIELKNCTKSTKVELVLEEYQEWQIFHKLIFAIILESMDMNLNGQIIVLNYQMKI